MSTQPTSKKQVMPLLILLLGILLMVFKIYADSEPGALPLLLILIGAVWYFFQRRAAKLKKTQ